MSETEKAEKLRKRLELLGSVSLLSTMAVLRVLKERRTSGVLSQEEWRKMQALREDIERGLAAVDEHMAGEDGDDLDLSGLKKRLTDILSLLDQWPPPASQLPS